MCVCLSNYTTIICSARKYVHPPKVPSLGGISNMLYIQPLRAAGLIPGLGLPTNQPTDRSFGRPTFDVLVRRAPHSAHPIYRTGINAGVPTCRHIYKCFHTSAAQRLQSPSMSYTLRMEPTGVEITSSISTGTKLNNHYVIVASWPYLNLSPF